MAGRKGGAAVGGGGGRRGERKPKEETVEGKGEVIRGGEKEEEE